MSAEPWWASAFKADYLRAYPHRDLAAARAEAAFLVQQGLRGRVLDLCCGQGRHCLALRELGLDIWGLDYSAELLALADELPGARALLAGRLLRADARALPLQTGRFDGVVNLFSSFGYFGEQGDRQVLHEIARVLRPGGRVVLDLMNPERVRRTLVPESRRELDGGELIERRALLDGGRRVVKHLHWSRPDGSQRHWREDVRLYGPVEIADLLQAAGLQLETLHGDLDGTTHGPTSPRQVVVAGRAGPGTQGAALATPT